MRGSGLVRRGLTYYWRTNLGLLLGTLVTSATLVGALVVGDSVHHSLGLRAQERLGRIGAVLDGGDRFFRSALARPDEQAGAPVEALGDAAAAIRLAAVVSTARGDRRVHDVRLMGVDGAFFELAATGGSHGDRALQTPRETGAVKARGADRSGGPEPGEAWLGGALARRLGVEPGTQIVVRVEKPSALPRDMALAPSDTALALRVRVGREVGAAELGAFDLSASSSEPLNLFVDLGWLQQELELEERANLILGAGDAEPWDLHLAQAWSLGDGQLEVVDAPRGERELRTARVFLDHAVVNAIDALPVGGAGIFTYFVNGLAADERETPYSMVAGLAPVGSQGGQAGGPVAQRSLLSLAPDASAPDSIVLNRWVADDLGASPGDAVTLRYFLVDPTRRLVEEQCTFRVASIVELEGAAADPSLMPDFPGLADEENCRDWEPGTPVDLERIRDEDEVYWDDHRGTPKGFVTLAAARGMWANRYGSLTAFRFAAEDEERVVSALESGIDPADLGLHFRDVRVEVEAAADSPTDFGGLFVGLSFFLIVAAVLLAMQLFQLGVQRRSKEIGLLKAVGLEPAWIRRLFFGEARVLATIGVLLGAAAGLAYTRGILRLLDGLWSDAVSGTVLSFHARAGTVAMGAAIAWVVVLLSVRWTLRGSLAQSARELLTSHPAAAPLGGGGAGSRSGGLGRPGVQRGIILVAILGALAMVLAVDPSAGPAAAGAYFGAGSLLLTAGILWLRLQLRRANERQAQERASRTPLRSIGGLGLSGITRRPGRSLATMATMAIGTFLVLAIGSQRQGPTPENSARSSGTGGFALYGQTSLPVVRDLNDPRGREVFGLEEEELSGVRFVPLRVRAGDDASCLNLSRVRRPRLVGVAPEDLAERDAFRFTSTLQTGSESGGDLGTHPWMRLEGGGDGLVPGVVDATSLTWQLHLSIGDRLDYVDERGEPFQVEIVGAIADSILQGDVLIAESNFRALFPMEGGHRAFLIDAERSADELAEVSGRLTEALEDVGLSLQPTRLRLDEFHAVQNGYLAIFQVLGALGLLLGSIGLGTTLLQNTHERRAELGVAGALGFRRRHLARWILAEYGALLLLGLALGSLSALFVIVPAMRGPASDLSLRQVLVLFLVLAANGWLWIAVATRIAVGRVPSARLCEE